jgi:hypothetical protein
VRQERPGFDPREYRFQEFSELLNYAQDKSLVRIEADEKRGLVVYLVSEFHPSAPPPEQAVATEFEDEEYQPQPLVPGQPTATGEIPLPEPPPKLMRRPHARRPAGIGGKKRRQRPRGRGRTYMLKTLCVFLSTVGSHEARRFNSKLKKIDATGGPAGTPTSRPMPSLLRFG